MISLLQRLFTKIWDCVAKTLALEIARLPDDYRFFCNCENDFLSQALPCQMVSDAKRAYEAVIGSGIPSDNVRNLHDE
jgi:hypothetical protein